MNWSSTNQERSLRAELTFNRVGARSAASAAKAFSIGPVASSLGRIAMTLGGRHLTNAISTKLKKTAPADLPQTFGCYRICRSTRRSRRMVILLRTRTSLLAWRPFVQLTVLRCVPSCPVRVLWLYAKPQLSTDVRRVVIAGAPLQSVSRTYAV